MGVDGRGGRSGDGGRVGLVGFLLLFLVLLPKEAISGLVDGPCHVVLTPIEGIFPDCLAHLALPRLGRFLLPHLIFLLLPFIRCVLLVLLLQGLVVIALVSLASDGAELGIKFELTLQGIDIGAHCHDLLVVGGFGTPFPLRVSC
jgi:hypothetical protein